MQLALFPYFFNFKTSSGVRHLRITKQREKQLKVIYTEVKCTKLIRLFVSLSCPSPFASESLLFLPPILLSLLSSVGASVSTVVLLEMQAAQPEALN